ncbi:MAG TPA: magnesium transporter CorA family protein [Chloroflexota bacterium]|nr:magnesium transporter CorA family protein [Chloroflexota bacterium]
MGELSPNAEIALKAQNQPLEAGTHPGQIRTRLYHIGHPPRDAQYQDWPNLCQDDENLLWIDITAPVDHQLTHIGELLGIDPRAIAIARRTNLRPSVRIYKDHYLVTAISVDVDETGHEPDMTITEINAVAGRNFLFTVHNRRLPFFEELEERTATNPQIGRLDSSYLLYVLLDTLVADYAREFEEVEDEVERLEEQLLRETGRAALNQVMLMTRHIHLVRRIVAPHRHAFGVLVAADSPIPELQVDTYFRDLIARVDGLIEQLDHARAIATGSYDLYISNISHRTNQELRVLTYLSAVLLPMTVITGIFGTNFTLSEYEAWQPFYVMLGGMGMITVVMLLFFRWRQWL